ncbi:MAG: symmetrical bis(5'-nucleosyl)-tetraphosphatase [Thioalkalivibrionaceae bacterium]
MSVYAIGDIQGCAAALDRLLNAVKFDRVQDQLWFVGDLVNRGPDSLGALRRIRGLGPAAVCVLGNHDLHLLAVHEGLREARPRDTLADILAADDRDELIEWLASRPLLHYDSTLEWAMVHAGLPSQWTWVEAQQQARRVETLLRDSTDRRDFLAQMYGNEPARWDQAINSIEQARFTINALTRMRVVRRDGALDFSFDGEPSNAPTDTIPWTDVLAADIPNLVCGHWSAAGLRRTRRTLQIDTGCVWLRQLTAVRLTAHQGPEACEVIQIDCDDSVQEVAS